MDKAKVKRIAVSTAAVTSILLGAAGANAQDARLKSIVEEVNQANQIAQASQARIDKTADATSKLYTDFKTVLKTNAGLRAYNAQQRRVITKQEEEIEKIKRSIGQIDEIKRQVVPLMEDMVKDLNDFVELDIPFQIDERRERVESLRDVIDDPNVSDPERFRVILEAYKAEVQYGRSINAYEASLEDGRSVNFVRVGRVAFYYQTKDGKETATWDQSSRSWVKLDEAYGTPVKQLIRMARSQMPFDVLTLPVKAPVQKGR
ncbi:MAG: DUF3450 domain-containing protein [Alphaproteobacteria bacterium]|nr:DUF3450 domain-containing protein [Alphaproteobacteria bacterium]